MTANLVKAKSKHWNALISDSRKANKISAGVEIELKGNVKEFTKEENKKIRNRKQAIIARKRELENWMKNEEEIKRRKKIYHDNQ